MRRPLIFAAILALAVSGTALGSDPPNPGGAHLVSGGGRIWEGANPARATASITFAGFKSRLGPGTGPDSFRCKWTVQFRDVENDWLDGRTARTTGCGPVELRTMPAELDGVAGYSLSLVLVDRGEPGRGDQVRVVIRDAADVVLYDTADEFTLTEAWRTPLDAGNIQAWTEP